ncbi:MAG: HDOD domain-containing protein [Pseudomonadota bacterium]
MSQTNAAASSDGVIALLEKEIEDRSIEMPLLPDVAAEVLASTLDDKSNATRLADLIQRDQSLASHLLRIVNSPAFRGSTEIVALQQALARLGMERIREIALSVSLQGTLFQKGPYDEILDVAWQHGLRTALWSKEVARQARKNVEVAYLCGLLHNVGVPLVIGRLSKFEATFTADEIAKITQALDMAAGITLVEEWRLPSSVAMTIRFINDFASAKNAQDLVAIVAAGAAFAQLHTEEDFDVELAVEELLPLEHVQHLNFYPDDVEQLADRAEQIEQTVQGMK